VYKNGLQYCIDDRDNDIKLKLRLLYLKIGDHLGIKEFEEGSIPPYAILSHTWSKHGYDEVTFKDVKRNSYHSRKGFQKIQFCGRQARARGFRYF
jgi:hypothetical protein